MTTDKAYGLLTDVINQLSYEDRDELAEVASIALEILYEKAKDNDKMVENMIEKKVAQEESDNGLTF